MNDLTLNFYNINAEDLYVKYNSVVPEYLSRFTKLFARNSLILDIGSGSGRDLDILLNEGFDVFGIDPSRSMLKVTLFNKPHLKSKMRIGSIPFNFPSEFKSKKWDGILITAVLQHINDSDLKKTVILLNSLLKKEGYIFISVPVKYPGIIRDKDKNNRLFYLRRISSYQSLFCSYGFDCVNHSKCTDALNRDDIEWNTMLFKKNKNIT